MLQRTTHVARKEFFSGFDAALHTACYTITIYISSTFQLDHALTRYNFPIYYDKYYLYSQNLKYKKQLHLSPLSLLSRPRCLLLLNQPQNLNLWQYQSLRPHLLQNLSLSQLQNLRLALTEEG